MYAYLSSLFSTILYMENITAMLALPMLLVTTTLRKRYKKIYILRANISPDLSLYVNNGFSINCSSVVFFLFKLFK